MKRCFRCNSPLKPEKDRELKKEYPYYCPVCDENMYSFEAVDDGLEFHSAAVKIGEFIVRFKAFIMSLQQEKCSKCQAYFKNDLNNGGYLEGCALNKSRKILCKNAFLPSIFVKIDLAIMARYEKNHFSASYLSYLNAVLDPRD